jgi:hypothetical protein
VARRYKRVYRVTHQPDPTKAPFIVEGLAASPYAACKVAFRTLIKEGYIKQPPKFNGDLFEHTEVEIVQENLEQTGD